MLNGLAPIYYFEIGSGNESLLMCSLLLYSKYLKSQWIKQMHCNDKCIFLNSSILFFDVDFIYLILVCENVEGPIVEPRFRPHKTHGRSCPYFEGKLVLMILYLFLSE